MLDKRIIRAPEYLQGVEYSLYPKKYFWQVVLKWVQPQIGNLLWKMLSKML